MAYHAKETSSFSGSTIAGTAFVLLCISYFVSPYINRPVAELTGINLSVLLSSIAWTITLAIFTVEKKQPYSTGLNRKIVIISAYLVFTFFYYLIYGLLSGEALKSLRILDAILAFVIGLRVAKTAPLRTQMYIFATVVSAALAFTLFNDLSVLERSILSQSRSIFITNPINIGMLGMTITIIGLYFGMTSQKILSISLIVFGCVGVLLSGSRGPFVATIFAGAIMFGSISSLKYLAGLILISAATIMLFPELLSAINYYSLTDRFFGGGNASYTTAFRFEIWSLAVTKIITGGFLSIIGHGPASFLNYSFYARYPHNLFLEVAFEIGIFAAIALASVFGKFILNSRKFMTVLENRTILSLFVAYVTCSMVSFDIGAMKNLFFLIGLGMGHQDKLNSTRRCREH